MKTLLKTSIAIAISTIYLYADYSFETDNNNLWLGIYWITSFVGIIGSFLFSFVAMIGDRKEYALPCFILALSLVLGVFFKWDKGNLPKPIEKPSIYIPIDTITVYNAVKEQCDSEPIVTASRDTIKQDSFPENWIAISRHLLKEYNKDAVLSMHDTVWLDVDDTIVGFYVIKDVCNKRLINHVDLLCKDRKLGMWTKCQIIIYK